MNDLQYQRQGGRCFWHGAIVPAALMTRDHVYPRRRGAREAGGGAWVLACEACNAGRGSMAVGSIRFEKWLRKVLRGEIRKLTWREKRRPLWKGNPS